MKFNTSGQTIHIVAFNQSGRVSGVAGDISCSLSIDNGTRTPLTNSTPTEIGTTGEYVFNLTQTETNGYELSFVPECSSAGVQVLTMPSNIVYTISEFATPVNVSDAAQEVIAWGEGEGNWGATIGDGAQVGSGSKAEKITIQSEGVAVEGASVWVSTDAIGVNVIAGTLLTNEDGDVIFMLDPDSTYYIWVKKDGFNFTNPTLLET